LRVKNDTAVRRFATGATRNVDRDHIDPEGFISPLVILRYSEYMRKHRKQHNGDLRDSDNWQLGIPLEAYMKSGLRHFIDWWSEHRGYASREGVEDALCAVIFNASGYLFEILRKRGAYAKSSAVKNT